MDTLQAQPAALPNIEPKKTAGIKTAPLKMILFLWKPYRFLLVVTFVSLVIYGFLEGVTVALIYTVFAQTAQSLSAVGGQSQKIFSFITAIGQLIPAQDPFIISCVLLIISYFLKSVFSFITQFVSFYLSCRTKRDFHDQVFRKFLNADYSFFLNHKHGWLMHRTMTVPLEVSVFLDYIPRISVNAVRILAIIGALFFISPSLTAGLLVLAALYYQVSKVIATQVSYHIGKGKVDAKQAQNELAAEAFTGIKHIKISMAMDSWADRFWKQALKYSKLEIRDSIWLFAPPVVMEFVVMAALAACLIVLKVHFSSEFMVLLPVVATFGFSIQKIVPTFNLLGSQIVSFGGLVPILEVIYGILSQPERRDVRDQDIKDFKDKIVFKNVCFTYSGRDELFENLNFEIKRGETVAFVGPSGSGKSTIVDLLLNFYDVSGGSVNVDGISLSRIKKESWLGKIGLVGQDAFVFHGTIRDNICFGAEGQQEAMVRAARDANAHEFIQLFPQGYDTVVGDRGVMLSGGQRQRIAIARALFRNPEILILDEATSSLDSISEAQVQEAINHISKNRTVILVAHRLSTIINADKIIVLDNGKVVEEGTHTQLLNKKGFYSRLYETQLHLKEAK